MVVLTDGKENALETPHDVVRERVERRSEGGWEVLFIGANQDAALTVSRMGIDKQNSLDMSRSGAGTRAAYQSTSEQIGITEDECADAIEHLQYQFLPVVEVDLKGVTEDDELPMDEKHYFKEN